MEFEILSDEQLMAVLYLKDDLMHVFGEMLYSKDVNQRVFMNLKKRLELIDNAINNYVKKSETCFQIEWLETRFINPQETGELKTNVLGYHLKDTKVLFDGTIESGGYLDFSFEDKDWGTNIYVKNNILELKNVGYRESGYHYNKGIKFYDSAMYMIDKYTILGVGHSKDKELVKTIKESGYKF